MLLRSPAKRKSRQIEYLRRNSVDEHFRPVANQTGVGTPLLGKLFIWAFVTFLYFKIAFDLAFHPLEFPTLAAAFMGVMTAILTVFAARAYAVIPNSGVVMAFIGFASVYIMVISAITFAFAKTPYRILRRAFDYEPFGRYLIWFVALTSVPVAIHFIIYICSIPRRRPLLIGVSAHFSHAIAGIKHNIAFYIIRIIILIFCVTGAALGLSHLSEMVGDYTEKKRCEVVEHQPCTKFGGIWQSARQYQPRYTIGSPRTNKTHNKE